MTHRYAVEAVDRYLREVCRREGQKMDGKCVVLPSGHSTAIVEVTIKSILWWREVVTVRLIKNGRAANRGAVEPQEDLVGRTYSEWLLALGPDDLIDIPKRDSSAPV